MSYGCRTIYQYQWEGCMERFFSPRSVAVIGASNKAFNLAATICGVLKSIDYEGSVYAVNKKAESVHGCPGYASVLDVPGDVDLAVILIAAPYVPQVARDCGEKGIKNLIVESAGFAEGGDEGGKLQHELNEIAKTYGIRYMGPNCLGVMSTHDRFCCFFGMTSGMDHQSVMRQGGISYVIQSGGVGGLVMESLDSDVVGLNKVVCIGNKADVDEADLVDYFGSDRTEVICMYLENVAKGRKFFESARKSTKPILVYKVGRTREGARAATSHTAGMANNDVIFDRACRQSGIIRLKSISELYSLPKMFVSMPLLKGRRIAIFTNSGAFGGITADFIVDAGLQMAQLAAGTKEKLQKAGQLFNASNPVDLGPGLSKQSYLDIYEILLSAPEVDGLMPIPSIWQDFIIDSMADLMEICKTYQKPAAIYIPNALKRIISIRSERQIPIFESPEEAVRALSVSYQYYSAHSRHAVRDIDEVSHEEKGGSHYSSPEKEAKVA